MSIESLKRKIKNNPLNQESIDKLAERGLRIVYTEMDSYGIAFSDDNGGYTVIINKGTSEYERNVTLLHELLGKEFHGRRLWEPNEYYREEEELLDREAKRILSETPQVISYILSKAEVETK